MGGLILENVLDHGILTTVIWDNSHLLVNIKNPVRNPRRGLFHPRPKWISLPSCRWGGVGVPRVSEYTDQTNKYDDQR